VATSRIADSVGRVLGDRYRLTRPLGVGASAHVYVAEDVNLKRRVAIKVLHPALAADGGFLRRFRAEARAVGSLRHPNILTVFDWGEDRGAPYLVMELLEGGSLRSMLDRGTLLSPAQAAAVGADAARALDYAHRRGIVHRDIKPANLIFDDDGRVRVADFGLARALAEATWTEPAGAVVGTARYAAPEQARGQKLDDRADVYSLALVLIEAITGAVPFASDTTLGTLMARVERPLVSPPGAGALAPVLDAAGTVDPAGRLDAGALARRLDREAAMLPPPTPLALASPIEAGEVESDLWAPTEYPGRPRLFDGDQARADEDRAEHGRVDLLPGVDDAEIDDLLLESSYQTPPAPATTGAGSYSGPDPDSGRDLDTGGGPDSGRAARGKRSRRRRWKVLSGLGVLLLVLAAVSVGYAVSRGRFSKPSHPVPYLVGLSSAAARARLGDLHLTMAVSSTSYSPHALQGTVLSQSPSTGRLREGSTVQVALSLGPRPVAVPSLAGKPLAVAVEDLHAVGLSAGTCTYSYSMSVPAGSVISSSPAKGLLLPGRAVDLAVSKGKPLVAVPAVGAGATYPDYQASLSHAGLVATETLAYSDTVPSGLVMAASPAPGTSVVVGTTVTVEVSKGPHLVAVPNVATLSVSSATDDLTAYGFQVTEVLGNPNAAVRGTNPSAGTLALYGSPVVILTG
jgi:serine/threonine-protein kinase